MQKTILSFFLIALVFNSHSQNTKRWKINDSTFGEIQTDSNAYKTKKQNVSDTIQFFFLADFFNDTVKIVLGEDTLADTVLSTRKEFTEKGIKQVAMD